MTDLMQKVMIGQIDRIGELAKNLEQNLDPKDYADVNEMIVIFNRIMKVLTQGGEPVQIFCAGCNKYVTLNIDVTDKIITTKTCGHK
jgi:hypothetical protein